MMGYPRNESFTFSNFRYPLSRQEFCCARGRTWSQSVHSNCNPNVISTVFSLNMNVRQWGMNVLRDLDSALGTAHRVKGENRANARGKAVTDMLRDCWWPRLLQIPLETTQVGRNCDFDADDSEMRMQAFALFAGPSNSKFTAEDVFAHLQHVGSRSNKGFNKMNKCPIVSLTFFSSIVFVLNVAVCVQHGCNDCLRVGFAIQL